MSGPLESTRARLGSVGVEPAEAAALLILLSGAVVLTVLAWVGARPGTSEPTVQLEVAGSDAGSEVPGTLARPPSADSPDVASTDPPVPLELVVHVSGQVNEPGLVRLDDGDRVDDAVVAAGGPTGDADLSALNLARVAVDGEQIYVPAVGEERRPTEAMLHVPGGGAVGSGTPDGPLVDLNRADAALLQTLPGVGPVMADRIIAHRGVIGRFVDVTQLLEVAGIGPARLAELQRLVRVGP